MPTAYILMRLGKTLDSLAIYQRRFQAKLEAFLDKDLLYNKSENIQYECFLKTGDKDVSYKRNPD